MVDSKTGSEVLSCFGIPTYRCENNMTLAFDSNSNAQARRINMIIYILKLRKATSLVFAIRVIIQFLLLNEQIQHIY